MNYERIKKIAHCAEHTFWSLIVEWFPFSFWNFFFHKINAEIQCNVTHPLVSQKKCIYFSFFAFSCCQISTFSAWYRFIWKILNIYKSLKIAKRKHINFVFSFITTIIIFIYTQDSGYVYVWVVCMCVALNLTFIVMQNGK